MNLGCGINCAQRLRLSAAALQVIGFSNSAKGYTTNKILVNIKLL
jgi:hypothetical protein